MSTADLEHSAERFTLQARGIRKSFGGVEVLHGVDLDATGGSVLALLGENGAGKSTLVKIIAGDHEPDAGTMTIDGSSVDGLTPVAARAKGIRMIFQELADAPALSVAENISLGRWPQRGPWVNWRAMRRRAAEMLEQLDVQVDIDAPVGRLAVGERQIVEIARALCDEARCLVLDEPTAALSTEETLRLFGFIGRLRERGVALIYITHRLDELRHIADRVTVLRDGNVVVAGPASELTRRQLVSAMVGRAIGEVQRPAGTSSRDDNQAPLLRFDDASVHREYAGVNLTVRPGEILALYGKVGSGIAEVAETAFGLHQLSSGRLELGGAAAFLRGPHEAIEAGIGLVPGDRAREGAFAVRPVAENLATPSWSRLSGPVGFITAATEAKAYRRWHEALSIRSRNDPSQPLGTLSGGNQQKVLLGRWLERRSRVLVLVEPTRGVDVGAREEIYRLVRTVAADGMSVLVATSDHEEVVQLADRATIMARGRVVAELADDDITAERLIGTVASE